jgi:hypothetical protein
MDVRQMRSRPMVEALHVWLQEHLPPGTGIGVRCQYR